MNNRQKYWAFLSGFALLILGIAYVAKNADLFLYAGALLGFDVYMFNSAKGDE